jgi:prephenate dehydrogenase
MKIKTLTIVGVGLIGGSIGLAAKRRKLAERVVGGGRRQASLDQAQAAGAIDEGFLDLSRAVHEAEIAVFCTPVDQIAEQILASAPGCASGTLLTDAGSTKAEIVRRLEGRLPKGITFAGGHPLAGSEKRGVEHADADLFQNRLAIVTRTPATDPSAVERVSNFWRALGCRVRVMDPGEHDQALALTSHLPHLLAAALSSILPAELEEFTANGFRDTTRIAAGDPPLWTAIFSQNRLALLGALGRLDAQLARFREALTDGNWTAVADLLAQAKKVRDALGN